MIYEHLYIPLQGLVDMKLEDDITECKTYLRSHAWKPQQTDKYIQTSSVILETQENK
jgi:hypothetical protein